MADTRHQDSNRGTYPHDREGFSARVPAAERDGLAAVPALDLLEYLGARWYRAALVAAPVRTARLAVVGEVAGRFLQARRILNHLADRCLLGPDSPWFGPPGS